ncbi:flavin-containing monooxygenase [Pseudomonas benzenivorans]|uniref:NAD(P)/FAD-dependent oxidoreductase n=1 Tax=Pseudomonas benzenivorans TaxID=556533 RepID=A0ABY5HEI8_9PSED|nr:NAD(P)-binding domain-containing protein [Pseudomonas benzenivorans]UTW09680.1 NAD(P)/FAD-dependent oxidoreductase [Pseudomonas benzenivorans]
MITPKQHAVIIIGAGQAGLAMGRQLQRQGVDFLIVEAADRAGGSWRHYYDSLQLFSPAAYSALPELPFPAAPRHYPRRDEVVRYLELYAAHFRLPIRCNSRIERVSRQGTGFRLQDADGLAYQCDALVVASGAFSQPYIPPISGLEGFRGRVLHSSAYRNTQPFAGQRVVVVGAANSAVQIAHELAAVAEVSLATRAPVRFFPQRLLGLDFHAWLHWSGLERTRWLSDQGTPVLDDGRYRRALREGRYRQRRMFRRVEGDALIWADGRREPGDALIFATGFRPNLSFLAELPAQNAEGLLLQRDGRASQVPGLFFMGQPRQRNFASATLRGVGPDAAHLLPALLTHLRQPKAPTLQAL